MQSAPKPLWHAVFDSFSKVLLPEGLVFGSNSSNGSIRPRTWYLRDLHPELGYW